MKLVIDIPKHIYDCVIGRTVLLSHMDGMCKAIEEGVPLPKGHGRLKDVDAFISKVKADREHSAYSRSWTADDVLNALDNSYAPTIVAANSEVEE